MLQTPDFALLDQHSIRQIDFADMLRQINGAAYARAASLNTRMTYGQFREPSGSGALEGAWSSIVNMIVEASTGSPGFAEVRQDDVGIEHTRGALASRWLSEALDAAATSGFDGLSAYMQTRAKQWQFDLHSVRRVFNDVNSANQELDQALGRAVIWASRVKLGCTVIIAVSPLAAGAGLLGAASASAEVVSQAGVVSFIYSVGKSTAKDSSKGNNPFLGIGKEVGKKVLKDTAKSTSMGVAAFATMSAINNAVLQAQAEKKIASLTRRLAVEISNGKRAQMLRRITAATQTAKQASRAATTSRVVGAGAKSVPVIFAAKSVWDAITEYQSDVSGQ